MSSTPNNVDAAEIAKFDALASRWWDPAGEFKPLHEINPLRLDWLRQHAELAGKTVVDIGCGGDIHAGVIQCLTKKRMISRRWCSRWCCARKNASGTRASSGPGAKPTSSRSLLPTSARAVRLFCSTALAMGTKSYLSKVRTNVSAAG